MLFQIVDETLKNKYIIIKVFFNLTVTPHFPFKNTSIFIV